MAFRLLSYVSDAKYHMSCAARFITAVSCWIISLMENFAGETKRPQINEGSTCQTEAKPSRIEIRSRPDDNTQGGRGNTKNPHSF